MQVTFFKHGKKTVSLNGLRCIEEIHRNPGGGQPFHDGGVLHYEDGTKILTTLEFAENLAVFVTTPADQSK